MLNDVLLDKLSNCEMNEFTLPSVKNRLNYRAQSTVVNLAGGQSLKWCSVVFLSWGLFLGSFLFNISINDLELEVEFILNNFIDDSALGSCVHFLEWWKLLQIGFRLEHNKMQGNSKKLHQGRLILDIRKQLFTMGVVKYWNTFPSEVVDAPCLSVIQRHLDNVLNNTHYLFFRSELVRQQNLMVFVDLFTLELLYYIYYYIIYYILFDSIKFILLNPNYWPPIRLYSTGHHSLVLDI